MLKHLASKLIIGAALLALVLQPPPHKPAQIRKPGVVHVILVYLGLA